MEEEIEQFCKSLWERVEKHIIDTHVSQIESGIYYIEITLDNSNVIGIKAEKN